MQPKTGKIIYGWDPIFLVKQIYKAFLPKQCNVVVGVAGVDRWVWGGGGGGGGELHRMVEI